MPENIVSSMSVMEAVSPTTLVLSSLQIMSLFEHKPVAFVNCRVKACKTLQRS